MTTTALGERDMSEPIVRAPISRRTLLVSASLVLLTPAVRPLPVPAAAAAPTMTYGHGYTGGY